MSKCSMRLGMLAVLLFVVSTSVALGGTVAYSFVPFALSVTNSSGSTESFALDLKLPFDGGPDDTIAVMYSGFLVNKNSGATVKPISPSDTIVETYLGLNKISALSFGVGCGASSAPNATCSEDDIGVVKLSGLFSLPPYSGALDLKLDFLLSPGGQYFLNVGVNLPDPGPGSSVPEPTSLLLLGLGILGLGATFCRRRSS